LRINVHNSLEICNRLKVNLRSSMIKKRE